jgi:hypothetical protein
VGSKYINSMNEETNTHKPQQTPYKYNIMTDQPQNFSLIHFLPGTSATLILSLLNPTKVHLFTHNLTMRPQPRRRAPTAKVAANSTKPTPPLTSDKPQTQRLIIKIKTAAATPASQLLSPPITPETEITPSRRLKSMGGMAKGAADLPKWMLKMQGLQEVVLPGLSNPTFTLQAKTYTEVS